MVHLKIRLTDADLSFIAKTITDNGNTLILADVQWANDGTCYTATATYTGTSTSRYATGYTVTASYTGQVAKTNCEVVIYTAIFGSVELPEEPDAPGESTAPDEASVPSVNWAGVKTPLMIGGAVLLLVVGGAFAFKKIKRR